jgi:hypothetical protein
VTADHIYAILREVKQCAPAGVRFEVMAHCTPKIRLNRAQNAADSLPLSRCDVVSERR